MFILSLLSIYLILDIIVGFFMYIHNIFKNRLEYVVFIIFTELAYRSL